MSDRRRAWRALAAAAVGLLVIGFGVSRADAAPSSVTATIVNSQLQVTGTDGADQITLRLRFTDPTFLDVDAGNDGTAEFSFPRAAFSSINVDLAGGADVGRIDQSAGLFTDTQPTTFNGGDGNDMLFGGNGPETFNGGAGADFVDGRPGADVISLGGGNDVFQWDPGDASDVVNGNAGVDRMLFNGANVSENIDLSANGSRLRFTRDIASVTMDLGTVEQIDVPIRGGTDKVAVHDLTGTGVTSVNVDFANVDPTVGDGAVDQVIAEGTDAADTVSVTGANGVGTVTGLAATVNVTHAELANDIFSVNTLGGDDRVTADPATGSAVRAQIDTGIGNDSVATNGTSGPDTFSAVPDGAFVAVVNGSNQFYDMAAESLTIKSFSGPDSISAINGVGSLTALVIAGGEGNDILRGGDGADVISGGAGRDFIDGNLGQDVVSMGDGDDVFNWDPGDSSDSVNGDGGTDRVVFNGANISEVLDLSANGSRARLTRDIASVAMDIGTVEQTDVLTRGGTDRVTVHDLAGTGMASVNVDLAGSIPTEGDGAADQVIAEGTEAADTVSVTGANGVGTVTGLAATVNVTHAELANDIFSVNTLGGDDGVTADPATGSAVRAQIDTGTGNDSVVTNGTSGADTFSAVPDGAFVAVVNGSNQFYDMAAESLTINGFGGDDSISAINGVGSHTALVIAGGDGNDILRGGDGADVIDGGIGNDFVDGNLGQDVVSMGDGDDVFNWDPGDSSDSVNGDAGTDRVVFNGANISEVLDLSANGSRVRLTRDIASATMDIGTVEQTDVLTRGGTDRVTVHDLAGTGMAKVNADLAGSIPTQGDGQSDQVIVEGTNGVDTMNVAALGGIARVAGMAASVRVLHADFAFDRLDVNTLDGDDTVTSFLPSGIIQLFVDGVPA